MSTSLDRICFDGFDKPIIKQVKGYLKNLDGFLYIYGAVGTGKTQLIADMVRHFIENREPILIKQQIGITDGKEKYDDKWSFKKCTFIKEAEFFNFLKTLWQHDSRVESDKIDILKKIDLFFIDDMGVKGEAPWIYERYYQIIDARYCNKLPTVITSNLSPESLKEVEPRVASRACSGDIIELQGEDRRTA